MDEKICLILILVIIFSAIFTVRGIISLCNVKAKQSWYSDFMNRFNHVNNRHLNLCRTAQYYIKNNYIYDVEPHLLEYNQNACWLFWQADRIAKSSLQFKKRAVWENMIEQAHLKIDCLNTEQNKFFQILNDCEQEEEKYKKAFAKYGPKTEEKDSFEVSGLFNGCTDYESLHKRYKALMKVYHSDIQNGDNEMATKINAEYERLKKKYGM